MKQWVEPAEDPKRGLGGPGGRTLFHAADIDPHTRVSGVHRRHCNRDE
jgi:hypothetical protein